MYKIFFFFGIFFFLNTNSFAINLPYVHKGLTIDQVDEDNNNLIHIKGHYDMLFIHKKFTIWGQKKENKFLITRAIVNNEEFILSEHKLIKEKLERAIQKMYNVST